MKEKRMVNKQREEKDVLLAALIKRVQSANRKMDQAGVISNEYRDKLYGISRIILEDEMPVEQSIHELEQLAD